jgi:FKBP-type peptidyl-prolyl cis-trans isomerase FklB
MRIILSTIFSIFLLSGLCLAGEKPVLATQTDKESYSLGYQFGENLKFQGLDINLDIYLAGIRDALSGNKPGMSREEMNSTVLGLRQRLDAEQQKKLKEQTEKNLAEGTAFLEENGKKEGVKTLPSGLQYKVLSEGTGKTPKKDDTVTVNYRGTFIDGKEFDSSISRGQPATFRVDGVIKGWTEALQLMKEGAKWKLFVPAEMAYGQRGIPPRIPPYSTLIFDMELVSIK